MMLNYIITAALVVSASASPAFLQRRQGGAAYGNGPYGAVAVSTDPSLPNHSIYIPDSSKTGNTKLPVLVWGNGGCSGDGASNAQFLGTVASYGYLAIASGSPGGKTSTTASLMTASIDFAVKVAGSNSTAGGRYANVDATKIMTAGFSCGGVEAMAMSWDSRVSTFGIFSSGLLTNYTAASTFTKPLLYVIGGSGDVAYQNAERDFHALPATTPAWKGNLPLGHGGDLFTANGGKFGRAGIAWPEYMFRGNVTAGNYFLANGSKVDGWAVETHALNLLKLVA